MIKAFIFDLDGVITDTANFHYLAWKRLADELGVAFDRERNEALRGVSRRQSLLILLNGLAAEEQQLEEWMERKNDYYRDLLKTISPSDLLPGAREILVELKEGGYKVALASASKNADEVIDRLHIRNLLDVICDGYTVDAPKPAPDLFLAAAAGLGELPEHCVVVEDAEAGVEAGIAAGMKTIGIGPKGRVGAADLVLENGFEGVMLMELLQELCD